MSLPPIFGVCAEGCSRGSKERELTGYEHQDIDDYLDLDG
jgi:hypothetical protein